MKFMDLEKHFGLLKKLPDILINQSLILTGYKHIPRLNGKNIG